MAVVVDCVSCLETIGPVQRGVDTSANAEAGPPAGLAGNPVVPPEGVAAFFGPLKVALSRIAESQVHLYRHLEEQLAVACLLKPIAPFPVHVGQYSGRGTYCTASAVSSRYRVQCLRQERLRRCQSRPLLGGRLCPAVEHKSATIVADDPPMCPNLTIQSRPEEQGQPSRCQLSKSSRRKPGACAAVF